ncbi:MAG: Oligopeptidase [Candidatus Parcubacteria bacterium]|jgi:peptidyl-dipeptidase Dcp
MNTNPLIDLSFNTPEGFIPFGEIQTSHYIEAIQHHIEIAKNRIQSILELVEPNFENTIEALEYATYEVQYIHRMAENLNLADTNTELQKVVLQLGEITTSFWNDISLNAKLFLQVKKVYDNKTNLNLSTPDQKTLLEETYSFFTRNGALLEEDQKQKLRSIDLKISNLSQKFGQNVLAENNNYKLVISDKSDLVGIPESIISQYKSQDNPNEWIVDLSYPSYIPFMQYAQNRNLRKELFLAYNTRGAQGNEYDNREILKQIATLKQDRAQLLGYQTHADYILEKRMLSYPSKVEALLDQLLEKAIDQAKLEIADVAEFAGSEIDELRAYDYAYYADKIKQTRYKFDEERIRQYFPLNQVLQGLFNIAKQLYGLQFILRSDIPVYNKEVEVYEVQEANGEHIGILYLDYYPRPGKSSGAWMTEFRLAHIREDKTYTPHISLVLNFTRPQGETPALLTLQEVLTLFHEFGHGLHGLLGKVKYSSLNGTNVYWDFVELPSQLMENWVYETEILSSIAKHWQTGEPLSSQDMEIIQAVSSFHEAAATVRQIRFGKLDLAWHYNTREFSPVDVNALEEEINQSTALFPAEEGVLISSAFSHIFDGGYSAGYYSYKYSELLDADAFEYFLSQGKVLDSEIGAKFREHILSKGGSEHPMTLYKRFRGQEPSIDSLLRRLAKSTK